MVIKGYYLDGKTSQQRMAILEYNESNSTGFKLSVESCHPSNENITEENSGKETVVLFVAFIDTNISSRLGNTPREFSFGSNQLFITEDNEAVDQFTLFFGKRNSLVHRLESKMTSVVIASISTILIVWGVITFGIPSAAKVIANKMPAIMTDQLGSTLDVLDETVFEPSSLSLAEKQRVRELAKPFLLQHRDLEPKLNFRSGMKANALALPNGDIVFTDDFINLVENDEQLIAVLFHELGHLKHKHLARRVLQDSMITLLVILITGDIDTIDLLTGLPTLILDLSYSRDFEIEADGYALKQLHLSNIPLESFSSVMLLLQGYYNEEIEDDSLSHDVPSFLMTHPATEDRVLMTEEFKRKINAE